MNCFREKQSASPAATTRRSFAQALSVLCLGICASTGAFAQNLPNIVRIIVPFPGGSPVENSTRALVQALNNSSGRTYIIDNKPGAAGLLGAAEAAKAKGDGSTLLLVTGGFSVSDVLYTKLPYKTLEDFRGVSQVLTAPGFALLVRTDSPYRNLDQYVAAAKKSPGRVSYASMGNGGVTHLIGALFARAVNADFMHVPYRVSALPDLLGGHVDSMWLGTTISKPLIASGQVRALATSGPTRMPEAPEAPTMKELGLTDVDVPAWTGFVAPVGTPKELIAKIYEEISVATKQKEFIQYVQTAGNDVVATRPDAFDSYLKAEVGKLQKTLPPLGIKMD